MYQHVHNTVKIKSTAHHVIVLSYDNNQLISLFICIRFHGVLDNKLGTSVGNNENKHAVFFFSLFFSLYFSINSTQCQRNKNSVHFHHR